MQTHAISIKYEKALAFSALIDQHPVKMDTTGEGSSDYGASPKKLLLAGLAGCTGIDVVSILQKMQVPFEDFQIRVSASLSEGHPSIYQKVSLIYVIKLAVADQAKMERAVQLSMEKYCGVSAMFSKFATLTHEIQYL